MRDFSELIARLKQSDDNCNAECCECSGECLSSGCNIFSEAADAIEELLAAVPHWISVEDELPEEWRAVLAYMPIHSDEKNPHMIRICWYIGYGKWRETEYGEIVEIPVTHWMHLPEPPKGVE